MQDLIKDFLRQKSFAVVGSFRNKSKYAYQILQTLKRKGHTVYPVNPQLKEVEGMTCYASIGDIPGEVNVANLVTPPVVTEKIVVECKKKGIRKIWIQPGAESEKAIKFCKDNDMQVVYKVCVMIEMI